MRAIKFRGWLKEKKIMVSWDELLKDKWLLMPFTGNEHFLTNPLTHVWDRMQYTGLKDKNGVEIYEGDIVSDHNQYNPQDLIIIEWRDAGFTGRYHNNNAYVSYVPYLASKSYLEVIGNIHENPELLK